MLFALIEYYYHVSRSNYSTKPANNGTHWGSVSISKHALCFVKDLKFVCLRVLSNKVHFS